uniref:Transmembrane protein n=1 Tax=Chromera velia CCMP2878 TaxID=1169474 RepID=A0A0G4HB65_9ALVE|eukprot:Cvel_25917.t1-p1 / transcript=Cvel_25917.t1 / gene=Cvel_25917 / organism=Chromera_velia_CCMP2878 / gene_product=hypothetical protein / transcript_product=hypothetical protein / location=Cvel_scaffold2996:13412-17169(-) / protein_length=460 / sequence_SO=supercontig / SO=protein_coding / is_pseudo=false
MTEMAPIFIGRVGGEGGDRCSDQRAHLGGLEPRLRSPDLVDSGDEAPVLLGDRLVGGWEGGGVVSAAVFRKYQAAVRQMERAAKDLADAPKKEKLKKLQEQGAARTCRTMTAWRRKEEFLAEEAEKVKSESIRKQLASVSLESSSVELSFQFADSSSFALRDLPSCFLLFAYALYSYMLTAIVTALLFQRFVTTVRHGPPPLFSDLTHDVLEMKYARLLGKTVSSIPRMGRKPQQRSVPVLPAASAGKGSPRGSLSSSQGARASFARRRRPSWFLYGFDLNKDLSAVDSKALQQREGIDRLFHSIGKIRRMPIETDNSDSVREPPLPVLPSLQSGVGPGPSAALSRGSVSEAKLQPQQPSGTPAGIAPGQALSSARRSSNFLVQYLQAEASQRVGATGASKDGSAGAGGGRRGTRRGSQNRKEGGGAQGSTGGPTAVGGGRKASAAMGSSGTSAKPGGGR